MTFIIIKKKAVETPVEVPVIEPPKVRKPRAKKQVVIQEPETVPEPVPVVKPKRTYKKKKEEII
jgi:hypothetical protein